MYFSLFLPAFTYLFTALSQQKTRFCLPTKVRFLNDVCLRQMMTASPNDVRYANDVCLTAHWANVASLRNEVEQHHICKANASYRLKAMHHLRYTRLCLDLFAKVWYNKLTENPEFDEENIQ